MLCINMIVRRFILTKRSAECCWIDLLLQTKCDVGDTFQKILLEKVQFGPPVSNAFTLVNYNFWRTSLRAEFICSLTCFNSIFLALLHFQLSEQEQCRNLLLCPLMEHYKHIFSNESGNWDILLLLNWIIPCLN